MIERSRDRERGRKNSHSRVQIEFLEAPLGEDLSGRELWPLDAVDEQAGPEIEGLVEEDEGLQNLLGANVGHEEGSLRVLRPS